MAGMRKKKGILNLVKDERGQWIISAGFLVSVSIIILALLLNQAMMGGYQSSAAILEFPKHEIRELVQETHREVIIAADRAWEMAPYNNTSPPHNTTKDRDAVIANFTIANFTNQTLRIYATHGQMVYMNVSSLPTCNTTTNKIERVNVTILFSDGVTTCTFEPEIIEIPVSGPSFATETLYADNLSCNINCTIKNETYAHGASNDSVATVLNVSNNGTVNATIGNRSVGSWPISSVKFKIRLNGSVEWINDTINISYSPDAGGNWSTVGSSITPIGSLTWYGNYPAANVTTWGEVDNMTIRITGVKVDDPDNGNLSIDAYHVSVKYYQ